MSWERMVEALRIFWIWWREQLLDLVPGRMARRASRADDGLLLRDLDDSEFAPSVIVAERRQGLDGMASRLALAPAATEPVRSAAARRALPIILQLPDTLLLEREVSLPLAAERDLDQVLFHEIDRFTPFTAPEVYWSYAIQDRDRTQGRLRLRLSLVPRTGVAALIARLREGGLPPAGLELRGADGESRRIGLDEAAAHGPGRSRLALPAAACACLLAAVVALPFLMQARAMTMVGARIAADLPAAQQAQQLRRTAAASSTGSAVVAAERARAGDALEALALLTAALPDNTYLTSLTFDAGKLTMDGQSKSAAALIAPLTANRQLQDASFTAPVVRNTLGADSFSMRLRVTQ